jgi:hypothetical protein
MPTSKSPWIRAVEVGFTTAGASVFGAVTVGAKARSGFNNGSFPNTGLFEGNVTLLVENVRLGDEYGVEVRLLCAKSDMTSAIGLLKVLEAFDACLNMVEFREP